MHQLPLGSGGSRARDVLASKPRGGDSTEKTAEHPAIEYWEAERPNKRAENECC